MLAAGVFVALTYLSAGPCLGQFLWLARNRAQRLRCLVWHFRWETVRTAPAEVLGAKSGARHLRLATAGAQPQFGEHGRAKPRLGVARSRTLRPIITGGGEVAALLRPGDPLLSRATAAPTEPISRTVTKVPLSSLMSSPPNSNAERVPKTAPRAPSSDAPSRSTWLLPQQVVAPPSRVPRLLSRRRRRKPLRSRRGGSRGATPEGAVRDRDADRDQVWPGGVRRRAGRDRCWLLEARARA